MSRYTLGTIKPSEQLNSLLAKNTIVLNNIPRFTGRNHLVAYGYDHACGYFLQLFDDADECVEYDSLFQNLTGAELAYFLSLFGGNPYHIELAYVDMPF